MAEFEVKVVRIEEPVEDHPNADRLSIIKIGGYVCIANKYPDGSARYKQGDLVVYIPEGAVLPESLLREMNMWDEKRNKGELAGAWGNRVKAIKLRGIVSQGLLYPGFLFDEGDDVAAVLGITKFEPKIPTHMAGNIARVRGSDDTKNYDVESLQKLWRLFDEGELVQITEKLHGTNVQIGYIPHAHKDDWFFDGCLYVTSKGLGKQGFTLSNSPENTNNLYVKLVNDLVAGGFGALMRALSEIAGKPVRIYGEIYGKGVQDLHYGTEEPRFAAFDVQVGDNWMLPDRAEQIIQHMLGLTHVPVYDYLPFSQQEVVHYRDGESVLTPRHIREGVVIRSCSRRKIAKLVSPDYLLRKNEDATEFA